MIILPKEKPVLQKLNSYYVTPQKLVEHCQGDFGSGIIHFGCHSKEGSIFFDEDEVLNSVLVSDKVETQGQRALDVLLEPDKYNFIINVFRIAPELIDFWSQTPASKLIYNQLNTEFTDFDALVDKMKLEKLSGFFNISLNNNDGDALFFFSNGEVVGGSFSWGNSVAPGAKKNHDLLIKKLKTQGGTFDVSEISTEKLHVNYTLNETVDEQTSVNVLELLEELLMIVENELLEHTKTKEEFSLLLKNKFVQKADQYPCLDPFVAEFKYANRKITYTGSSNEKEVTKGVIESLKELAEERGALPQVMNAVGPWRQKYGNIIKSYGVEF